MDERPRYMISVAAELVGMHPQTLRMYEQKGLLNPQRTAGNTRLYSDADIERLASMVNDPKRPVQFLFAGKAHPHDEPGKLVLQ